MKKISGALLLIGAIMLLESFYFYSKGYIAQILLENAWKRTLEHKSPQLAWPWAETHPVGKIYFPKLDESFTILDGTSTEALAFGPGLVEGSTSPGDSGNICIAGHRDTFFNNIKNLSVDDIIRIDYIDTQQLFQITSTNIVQPEDTRWLSPSNSFQLTLITCYPFTYIGDAPERYIVRAELINS